MRGYSAEPAHRGDGPNALVGVATAFDPSDHTVDEVLEYLDENPGERDHLYELESAGKARVSLLPHLTE